MITEPIVSVIVPIFNVEPYIRKCLDSLKNQTMKEIEVICVDDGSTDKSGDIAEEYVSSSFPIFRIIHTKNRGLSAARNRGIEEAKAAWLMFVDSDDWVDSKFCEIPYRAAVENDADLVIFGKNTVTRKGKIQGNQDIRLQTESIDHETAIDVGGITAWNKLYKSNLFYEISFPEGHVYEDIAITHKLVYCANRIVIIPNKLYFRQIRNNSIGHNLLNETDRLAMSKLRTKDLIAFGYPREKAMTGLYRSALKSYGAGSTDTAIEASKILSEIKVFPQGFSKKERVKLTVWRLNRGLYRCIYRSYLLVIKKYKR